MNTIDDILEILKTSQENLEPMLEACGWSDLTEFTDEQAETLLAMKAGHEEKNRDYVEGYLRNIAHNVEISGTQFDEIAEAIAQAGGTLLDYRDPFQAICQRVKDGVTPQDAVMPPQKDIQIDLGAEDPFHRCEDSDVLQFIKDEARTAATITLRRIQGFADKAAEEQDRLEKAFLKEYRRYLAESLMNPEFKAQFALRMQRSLDGKKPQENALPGVPTPTALLSNTN